MSAGWNLESHALAHCGTFTGVPRDVPGGPSYLFPQCHHLRCHEISWNPGWWHLAELGRRNWGSVVNQVILGTTALDQACFPKVRYLPGSSTFLSTFSQLRTHPHFLFIKGKQRLTRRYHLGDNFCIIRWLSKQVFQLLFRPTALKLPWSPLTFLFLKTPLTMPPTPWPLPKKPQQNHIYTKIYIPCVPGFDEAGVEAELRNGSEDGSRKFVLRFALHEMLRLSSDKLSKLGLLCLLVSRRSFPKKASWN